MEDEYEAPETEQETFKDRIYLSAEAYLNDDNLFHLRDMLFLIRRELAIHETTPEELEGRY